MTLVVCYAMSFAYISAIIHRAMKVSEIGEFGLIDLIDKYIARHCKPSKAWRWLKVGIGDDCAVWRSGNNDVLQTTDTMVEGVHFKPGLITWRELGWKSLAINLSDIAAMGGTPEYILVSLSIPATTSAHQIIDYYKGLLYLANRFGVAIAGGNLAQSLLITVNIAVTGALDKKRSGPLLRSNAKNGDLIAITGYPGLSSAGLRMLASGMGIDVVNGRILRKAHNTPWPRINEGMQLRSLGVRCGIDVSDGLVGDLAHICQTSLVSAVLMYDQIPVHRSLRMLFPSDFMELILYGCEDYVLLFTAPAEIVKVVKNHLKCPVTVIGEIIPKCDDIISVVDTAGRVLPHSLYGWDHFAVVKS